MTAPKAKGKTKAKARRLRVEYRARGNPAPVLARNAARHAALLALPGRVWECGMCGHGRHIPHDHAPGKHVKCDGVKVRMPGGDVIQCLGRTTVSSWRQGTELTAELATARHAAMQYIIVQTDQQAQAEEIPHAQFWGHVLEKMRAVAAPAVAPAGNAVEAARGDAA